MSRTLSSSLAVLALGGILLLLAGARPVTALATPSMGSNCASCHGVAHPTAAPGKEPKAPAAEKTPATPAETKSAPGQVPQDKAQPPATRPASPAGVARSAAPAGVAKVFTVTVNGQEHRVRGRVLNGRALVPARSAAPWLEAVVDWDNRQKAVTFRAGEHEVVFFTRIGRARVDGQDQPAASLLWQNTAWVPLRFLAEVLGAVVSYEPPGSIVIIAKGGSQAPAPPAQPSAQKVKVDHSAFIQGPLASGPEVTARCLGCHAKEGQEMLASEHWLWQGPTTDVVGLTGAPHLGKGNGSLNNL